MSSHGMIFRPYAYQRRAIDFVKAHPYCALFLDMGLGKTVSTLTAFRELMDDCEVSTMLVVAPKKVAEATWADECAKWEHLRGLRVSVILGTSAKRRAAMRARADVYVTSRDLMGWLVAELGGAWPYDMLVLDELTSFKNPKAGRFRAVRLVRPKCKRVVGLTGTPTPNGLKDLWAQIYCLDMGARLGRSVTSFRGRWFNSYGRNGITYRLDAKKGAEEEITGLIGDITLAMRAEDYLELPPLMERDVVVSFSDATAKRYEAFERERVMELADVVADASRQVVAGSAAALMSKLQQFAGGAVYDTDGNAVTVHEEKLDALDELMERAAGEHVLIFYQFKHEVARIAARLKGLRVRKYEGADDLRAWNAGEVDVMLAHPASTAYGLNMQAGGNVIIWYGTGFNADLYTQAVARLYRQGQQKPVRVFRLLVRGTVDEDAARAVARKLNAQDAVIQALEERLKKYTV